MVVKAGLQVAPDYWRRSTYTNGIVLLVALMDLGYVTHAVHANTRLVYLECSISGNILTVTGPPNGNVYPPGPGWIYFLIDDIPSKGVKVMVGNGQGPPVDDGALNK